MTVEQNAFFAKGHKFLSPYGKKGYVATRDLSPNDRIDVGALEPFGDAPAILAGDRLPVWLASQIFQMGPEIDFLPNIKGMQNVLDEKATQ